MKVNDIEKALYRKYCEIDRNFIAMIPNCYTLLENECDILGVRKSLLTDEFEIKTSRQDFFADFKKQVRFKQDKGYSDWILKSKAYERGLMPTNHFWYVAPSGLISLEEIPPHAGFLEVFENGLVRTSKISPKINKTKMPEKDLIHHMAKLSKKYWSLK